MGVRGARSRSVHDARGAESDCPVAARRRLCDCACHFPDASMGRGHLRSRGSTPTSPHDPNSSAAMTRSSGRSGRAAGGSGIGGASGAMASQQRAVRRAAAPRARELLPRVRSVTASMGAGLPPLRAYECGEIEMHGLLRSNANPGDNPSPLQRENAPVRLGIFSGGRRASRPLLDHPLLRDGRA